MEEILQKKLRFAVDDGFYMMIFLGHFRRRLPVSLTR